MDALERRVALTLACFYLLTLGGHHYSIDGIVTFEAAKALVFRGTLTLDPPIVWGEVVRTSSPYGLGASLVYAPLLLLLAPLFLAVPGLQAVPFAPGVARNPALYANLPYLLGSLVNPLITIATACGVLRLARRAGLSEGWAAVAALCYGMASPAAAYARFDFAQPLVALCLVAALLLLLRPSPAPLAAGGWLALAVSTRPEVVLLALPLAAWGAHGASARRGRVAACLGGPPLLALAAHLGLTWLRCGAMFDPTYHSPADFSPLRALREGLPGLLVSPGRGLLWFFPASALLAAGARALLRAAAPEARRLGEASAALVVLSLALYGAFRVWWGGWSWGPRFLVPIVPFLVLCAVAWASTSASRRRAFLALAALGALAALQGVLFDFVEHHRALTRAGLDPERAHYSWAASPLFGGWSGGLDLLLLRVTDREQVTRFAGLLGMSPDGPLAALVRLAGPTLAVALLALLARSLAALRPLVAAPRRTAAGSTPGGVG